MQGSTEGETREDFAEISSISNGQNESEVPRGKTLRRF